MSDQNVERIAKLEQRQEHIIETLTRLEPKVDVTKEDIAAIREHLSHQKGFFSGVMFVILPVWSAITLFAQNLWERMTQ
jgi:hypothetical protein